MRPVPIPFPVIPSSVSGRAKRAGTFLLDLLYPPRCVVCEAILLPSESGVCTHCRKELPFVKDPYCMRCGKPLNAREREYCADCEMHRHVYDEGRAVFLYEKGIRLSVNRLKFGNRRSYIPFYGECLFHLLREMMPIWRAECLVPIPMHPKKRAARGFDQAVLLSRSLSGMSRIPSREDVLIRTRLTQSSKKLGRSGRRKNLRGAFAVNTNAAVPESVILIDDIYTTGTTMDEASLALRKAGVRRIFFLTLCIGRGDV